MWNGWLGLASPVLSNMGTDRGLPISCFGVDTPDSIRGIGLTNAELMKLTASGGGVGISLSRIRTRGVEITGNGKSEGGSLAWYAGDGHFSAMGFHQPLDDHDPESDPSDLPLGGSAGVGFEQDRNFPGCHADPAIGYGNLGPTVDRDDGQPDPT